MLGTTLWFVVAIGLLAAALMNGAAAFGRAGVQAAADHAIEAAVHDAVADYQNRLQASGEHADTPAAPLERTFPPQTSGGAADRAFTLAYAVTPTTLAPPMCSPGGSAPSAGPDTIAWLQCGGFVRESRMSLRVVVRVLDAAGAETLARREQYVTLRLFGEPPYSAVVGRTDASAGDPAGAAALAAPPHEGDVGGGTVSGPSPPPAGATPPPGAPGAWPAGGTLIHVRYECRDGTGHCANAAPPDPDAGLQAGTRWANGNRPEL
jgi:hypothetical protein